MKKLILTLVGLGFLTWVGVTLGQRMLGRRLVVDRSVDSIIEPGFEGQDFYEDDGLVREGKAVSQEMIVRPDIFPVPPIPPFGRGEALEVDERLYNKFSSFGVVAKDVSQYMERVQAFVLSIKGRVISSSMDVSGRSAYGYLQMRVPVDKFEETNLKIASEADKVMSQEVSAEDVTGSVVSVQERITRLEDDKFEAELKLEKAKDDVERRVLERQIKQLEQQIDLFEDRLSGAIEEIDYASVSLRVSDSRSYFDNGEGPISIMDEIEESWGSVSQILRVLARGAVWVVVYGVLWLPVIMVVRWISGKFRRSEKPNS